jgi:hypothetical protein
MFYIRLKEWPLERREETTYRLYPLKNCVMLLDIASWSVNLGRPPT